LDAALKKNLDGPLVVHCSAGVGRSGAFVAIHMLLEKLRLGYPHEEIDVLALVGKLRKQRMGMVQTEAQFKFIFDTIADHLKDNNNLITKPIKSPAPISNVLKQSRNFSETIPEESKKAKSYSVSKVETSNWRTCSRALMSAPISPSPSPDSCKQRSLSTDSDPRPVHCKTKPNWGKFCRYLFIVTIEKENDYW
jgi:hypothetical protein